MRKKFYKITATMLAAVMTLSPMTVFAAEVTTQELGQGITSGQAEVVYDTSGDQAFTVVIPKKIVLGSDKTAEYDVTVKGDVAQGSKVKVEPRDDVESKVGINFIMTAEKSGSSKNVDVTQNDVYWNYSEIISETAKSGNVNGSELTFGKWTGDLTFLINFEDEYGDANDPTDTVMVAPENAYLDWSYKLDTNNKVIELITYHGNEEDLTVYSKYIVKDSDNSLNEYTTKLGNQFDGQSLSKVKSVYFAKDIDTKNRMRLDFKQNEYIEKIDISNLNINFVYMDNMFRGCTSLKEIEFGNIDTSNVESMKSMFEGCFSLSELNLSKFDTSNVTDMYGMFRDCTSLTNIDLSSLDTSNVTRMTCMFDGCEQLTHLDLSNFNTSNIENIECMFAGCKSLTTIDISSFDVSNVHYFDNFCDAFRECESLVEIDLSNFVLTDITELTSMLINIGNLEQQKHNLERIYLCVDKCAFLKEELEYGHSEEHCARIILDQLSAGYFDFSTTQIIFK